jgi:hypothetical protein
MSLCQRTSGAGSFHASGMDVLKMLAEMRQERVQIEEAIVVLERLARGQGNAAGAPRPG